MSRADKVEILKDADNELFNSDSVKYEDLTDLELDTEIAITLKMAIRNVRFLTNRVEQLTGIKK